MGRPSTHDYTHADMLLGEGLSWKKVSDLTGIKMSTLKSHKNQVPKGGIDWKQADELIRSGKSDYEVADLSNMERSTVRYHRVNVLKLPAAGRKTKHDYSKIDAAVKAGQAIPKNHGIPTSTLRAHKVRHLDVQPQHEIDRKITRMDVKPAEIIERKRKAMEKRPEEMPVWLQGPAGRDWRRDVRL